MHDPIGTDKEGNEITLIDILGTEADDVVDKVQLKIEKSKIYRNLDILDCLLTAIVWVKRALIEIHESSGGSATFLLLVPEDTWRMDEKKYFPDFGLPLMN